MVLSCISGQIQNAVLLPHQKEVGQAGHYPRPFRNQANLEHSVTLLCPAKGGAPLCVAEQSHWQVRPHVHSEAGLAY